MSGIRTTGGARTVLHVDWTRCDGRGLCTELLAGLERDEWGYPLAAGGEVPIVDGDLGAARDAVAFCPKQALRLVGHGRSGARVLQDER